MRLRRWLIVLCLVLPAALWFGAWGAGYVLAAIVTSGALAALAAVWWAGRRNYVRFVETSTYPLDRESADADNEVDPPSPLPEMDKVPLCATGHFEVSGMRRYLVETQAHYTAFETGERCIMAQVPFSRFLLVGSSKREEVGWWYSFFQPGMIRSVAGGLLYYGPHPRLALRLRIAAGERDEMLYLSFDDEPTRSLALGDLLSDASST